MGLSFPNESTEYRVARNKLLDAEITLRAQTEQVAEQRRALPPGGNLPEDYAFTDLDGERRRLSSLFGDHDTLALYSYMFSPEDEHPCPACTSLMDGWNGQMPQITQRIAFAAVSSAPPDKLAAISTKRAWNNITLLSAEGTDYQTRYFGVDADGTEHTFMNVFRKDGDAIRHFWGSEMQRAKVDGHPRHLDQIWPIWGMLDLTPEGRGHFFPQVFES